jgi:glycosyltransferase involved in cell wall biosynthesis
MHVIIDCNSVPAFLAHGGAATQIHGTIEGLREVGLKAEFAKWWETHTDAELVHYFGIPTQQYLNFAAEKNIPVISTNLFTAACNRSLARMSLQGMGWKLCDGLRNLPIVGNFLTISYPEALRQCSICVVGLDAEREVLLRTYKVPEDRIRIVPLALGTAFFKPMPAVDKVNWLINTGTITQRKRSLELARMAHEAEVPICFVGKPYDYTSRYWRDFKSLIDNRWVSHIPHTESVEEMRRLLVSARGFVLYSDYENWCLSAHEAAACGLPLLLPSQAWSIERFGNQVAYFDPANRRTHARALKNFYSDSLNLSAPVVEHLTWNQVSAQLIEVYRDALAKNS